MNMRKFIQEKKFFSTIFKKKDVEPRSPSSPETNAYLNARQEWSERYGCYIKAAQNWRLVALVNSCVAVLAVTGMFIIAGQQKIIPYVIQVDKMGMASAVGPANHMQTVDARVVKSYLARWISSIRSVYTDAGAQNMLIKESFSLLSGGSPAYTKALHYVDPKADSYPFKRAESEIVSVSLSTALQVSNNVWRVEWTEEVRKRDGNLLKSLPMQATITVEIISPKSETEILKNPMGIFIKSFDWGEILQ